MIFTMDMKDFLEFCKQEHTISGDDTELNDLMTQFGFEAQKITMELNTSYHSQEEVVGIFSRLTGKQVDPSFVCYPPFYTNFGKNMTIGKNVFFNMGCTFQDRGGIHIGDNAMIGTNVTIATLNHGLAPDERDTTHASPVHIAENAWIGSKATILPGVTIGKNAVVAAGAVVTESVKPNTVVGGVPAKKIKEIE